MSLLPVPPVAPAAAAPLVALLLFPTSSASSALAVELLLLGLGPQIRRVPDAIRAAMKAHGVVVEGLDTGAAARTYNVLLGESRRVAAALIAV